MLNRISGYLLFVQASYLATFLFLSIIDGLTRHSVFWVFRSLRSEMGMENTFVRASDYLYYPFAFSAPLNVFLLVVFLRQARHNSKDLSFQSDFFSILKAFYVVGNGWILFMTFANILGH